MSTDVTTAIPKPLVLVVWIDAADHDDTWVHESEAESFGDSDQEIISVGFLVSKTEKYVTLGGDWDAECLNYGRVEKIPALWVRAILPLDFSPIKG